MRKVCAWCSKDISSAQVGEEHAPITHGICSPCAVAVTNFEERRAGQILNLLQEPVFLVDQQGFVRAANRQAGKMLGKDIEEIEGQLGGDAFECSYARLPAGCGRTEHCATCAIRNTVLDTLSRGMGYANVPAFQKLRTPEGDRVFRFLVTTERLGDAVLLRIDDVSGEKRSKKGRTGGPRNKPDSGETPDE